MSELSVALLFFVVVVEGIVLSYIVSRRIKPGTPVAYFGIWRPFYPPPPWPLLVAVIVICLLLTWGYGLITGSIWELLLGGVIFIYLGYSSLHLLFFGGGYMSIGHVPMTRRGSGCLSSILLFIFLGLLAVFWGPHLAGIAVRLAGALK